MFLSKDSVQNFLQFVLGAILGSVIACSPTRFGQSKSAEALCEDSSGCIIHDQSVEVVQDFRIGSGKVDILFVSDNSASMSKNQAQLLSKFAGFLQNLDSKHIDYRIALTTTDLNEVQSRKLVSVNGKSVITSDDADRAQLFTDAFNVVKTKTTQCENFIISMFNYYGASFQTVSDYAKYYPTTCPSSDTRGIYAAHIVVSENSSSFMRNDANLNVILISNDNVRQGKSMENNDKASTFTAMMQDRYPSKYWDFNSIIVKDNACKDEQPLKNASNQVVSNASGPAVVGSIGQEYANLSNSAARDIDDNPRPRGQVLSICESNYANHFNSMATQISSESRMVTLKCAPAAAPRVSTVGASSSNVPFTWNGDKIIFSAGYEGIDVSISYSCYTGPT